MVWVTCNSTCQEGVGRGLAGWELQGTPRNPSPASSTPSSAPRTFGISCPEIAGKVDHGVAAGHRAPPGRTGLQSLCLTGSHQAPRWPGPGPPGVLGLRSWEPQDLAASEGSWHSASSPEGLPDLLQTCRSQISQTHRTDEDRRARGQPRYPPPRPPMHTLGH